MGGVHGEKGSNLKILVPQVRLPLKDSDLAGHGYVKMQENEGILERHESISTVRERKEKLMDKVKLTSYIP